MDKNLKAYGDVRRATSVWDTIPSIKFLLASKQPLNIIDAILTKYTNNSIILHIDENKKYHLDKNIGKEVIVIPNKYYNNFILLNKIFS